VMMDIISALETETGKGTSFHVRLPISEAI
jgi:chemotaxis protein histidine kinase CheA